MRRVTVSWRVLLALSCITQLLAGPRSVPPKIVLWSWSSESDLRFLRDPDIGVAYLALNLSFEGRNDVFPSPRMTPLRTAPNTWLIPVVRLDYNTWDERQRPAFSDHQRRLAARMIGEIADLTHAQAIQIDFDAPYSAQSFYRQLLADVRSRLGPNVFLSITALVSWCDINPSWLAGLPVDEIVPMAFDIGATSSGTTELLLKGGAFAVPGCRDSLGVALRIVGPARPRKNQRAYFFAQPRPWTPELVRTARASILP